MKTTPDWIQVATKEEKTEEIREYEYVNREDIIDVNIPHGITSIGERAFSKCKNLKRITIPDTVTHIGPSAFEGCENLEEITLPKNLKKIDYRLLANCKRLKKIIIPEGIKEISWGAFAGCENLEEIILPESIESLDKEMFLNCKKLKRVTLPSNVTEIPESFFKGCTSLITVNLENIKSIKDFAFMNCKRFTKFPENAEYLGVGAFRKCSSLTTVNLNKNIGTLLADTFNGCINLSEITCKNKSVSIGKRCFKNCISLKNVPDFIKNLGEHAFENCINLTEIFVKTQIIPDACFKNCKNLKKVINSLNIIKLGVESFENCEKLEELQIPLVLSLPKRVFKNCINLKTLLLQGGVKSIGTESLYNCINLTNFDLPLMIEYLGARALKYCHKIDKITIGPLLNDLGDEALSCMHSFENIFVHEDNKKFITPDNKILICPSESSIILYANGSKEKSYKAIKDYCYKIDGVESSIITPLTYIRAYAFEGAQNLEELVLPSCIQDIEYNAFKESPNLKKLNFEFIDFYSSFRIQLRNRGRYIFDIKESDINIPIETVTLTGSGFQVESSNLQFFNNLKELNLFLDTPFDASIGEHHSLGSIERVNFSKFIKKAKFGKDLNVTVKVQDGLEIKDLSSFKRSDAHIGPHEIYTLKDGTYKILHNGIITEYSKEKILQNVKEGDLVSEDPVRFLNFVSELYEHKIYNKIFLNGVLINLLMDQNKKELFKNKEEYDDFYINVLEKSGILDVMDVLSESLINDFDKITEIVNLFRKYNVTNPNLYNKIFIYYINTDQFEYILKEKRDTLERVVNNINFNLFSNNELTEIFNDNLLYNYIKFLQKYEIKDKFLLNKKFLLMTSSPLSENFFKYYDANLKRLIKESKILENPDTATQNLKDLLTLLTITGAFSEDEITRQKAKTFITENMFTKENSLPPRRIYLNGLGRHILIEDDIHRLFNFMPLDEAYNEEFANFFFENYSEIIKLESAKSGFIERVYKSFAEISRTCTSNKGRQRKLKVTIEKCLSYITKNKFDNIPRELQELANLIGAWYDNKETWENTVNILKKAQKAPRNIFTKVTYDIEDNPIYDYDPSLDLKEPISEEFSFEWLPKQDYNNFILGKLCNCCAHVEGAGSGIMIASMILDTSQNLVIRNEKGEIIAKSTICINKDEGYAVFNNVEVNLEERSDENLNKIYKAYLRGIKAFIKTYNENNINKPINIVTVGTSRNALIKLLTDEKHPKTETYEGIHFRQYALPGTSYNGDWSSGERLILKLN